MKEQTKKMILLIAICTVTIGILVVALKLNQNREENLLSESKIKNYLTEIKYDEISNHVIEQPSSVIYVSNSSEDSTKKFENIFIPVVKKYNLEKVKIRYVYVEHNKENSMFITKKDIPLYTESLKKAIQEMEECNYYYKNHHILCDYCEFRSLCDKDLK